MLRRLAITSGFVIVWTIAVIGAFVAEAYLVSPVLSDGKLATIENHLVRRIGAATEDRRLGSAAFALIERGEIAAVHGFGVARAETGSPVDAERTLYQVASVSKAVTAWGVMKLVQDKKLSLDEPVIRHLRRWRFPGSDLRRNRVTARHLLSHTAGLGDGLGYGFLPGEAVPTLEESLTQANDSGGILVREPGEHFAYSGSGYAVLQLLIEEITGRSFAEYMKESVLLPLGMRSSGFDLDAIVAEGRGADLATSYDHELRPAPHRRYAAKAGVSLYATPHDLARFARALVQDNPVLTPATLNQMVTPQAGTSGQWGLGHTLFARNGTGGYVVGHDGGTYPAWGAMVRVNPATRNGIVLLVSGGRGAVNQLGHDWVYWETGQHTDAGRRQRLYARIAPASVAIVAGALVIIVWQRRLGKLSATRH